MSFEKVLRSMMVAGLVSVTSMVGFIGCGTNSAQVIEDEYVPTSAETIVEEAPMTVYEMPEYKGYKCADGWSVKYNPDVIEVNEGNDVVGFTYMGDCAGTCMVTITTLEGTTAEAARAEMVETWGNPDGVYMFESPFMSTEEEAYWATMSPSEDSVPMYETVITVDHNGKTFLIEGIEHKSGNEEIDMAVSDTLASIIDSMELL